MQVQELTDVNWELLPDHIRGSVKRYIEQGIPPGGFLSAVIRNDLAEAYDRADHINQGRLGDVVQFFHSEAPSLCWGSQEKLDQWIARFEEQDKTPASE